MKQNTRKILIGLVFLIGLSLILYPTIGNFLNDIRNSQDITRYTQKVKDTSPTQYEEMFAEAREINKTLPGSPVNYDQDDPFYEKYKNALSLTGGMMGYLVIDKINVKLGVLHGTSEGVLQNSVGYLEGTHLPTGDIGNSTVLTGHTGLPSADLLTNLDQLEIGDTFELTVLDKHFEYEVFEINVVLPTEVDSVSPRPDIDMVTLLTCTPYGVNSHRLLVHGKQINPAQPTTIPAQTQQSITPAPLAPTKPVQQAEPFDTTFLIPFLVMPIIIALVLLIVGMHFKNTGYAVKRRHNR